MSSVRWRRALPVLMEFTSSPGDNMLMNGLKDTLRKYNDFSECIITDMRLLDFQTTVELALDYVWDDNKGMISDYENFKKITLIFYLVREIHLKNGLNDSQLMHPHLMNWSMNEIALIEIRDDGEIMEPYVKSPVKLHRAAVLWESDRRIDIVFSELAVIE